MFIDMIDPDEIYDRVVSGKPYNKDLKPYSEIKLTRVLKMLENYEEYEKCQFLKVFIEKRFTHGHDYTLSESSY